MDNVIPVFPVSDVQPERVEASKKFHQGLITLHEYRLICAALDSNRELLDLLSARS